MSTTFSFHSELIIRSLFILIWKSTSCSVALPSLLLCRQASSCNCNSCRAPAFLLLLSSVSNFNQQSTIHYGKKNCSPFAAVIRDFHRWPLFLTHSATNGTPRYMAFLPSSFAACREYTYPVQMLQMDIFHSELNDREHKSTNGLIGSEDWQVLESLFASASARLANPSLSPRTYWERNSLRNLASFSSLSLCTFLNRIKIEWDQHYYIKMWSA